MSSKAGIQQEGIWFHACNHSFSYWNFAVTRVFSGTLDMELLRAALMDVMMMHESMRSCFFLEQDGLYYQVAGDFDVSGYYSVIELPDGEIATVKAQLEAIITREFNPSAEFPFHFLVCTGPASTYCSFIVNHVIADNSSARIFWKDIVMCYNRRISGVPASPAQIVQYGRYLQKHRQKQHDERYSSQLRYWQEKLLLPAAPLELVFASKQADAAVSHAERLIPPHLAEKLRNFAMRKRVVYSAVFQLPYYLLLHKYSGKEQILMGNFYNGRGIGSKEFADTIGLFADRIANRLVIQMDDTLEGLLLKLNKEVLESFRNGEVPWEQIQRTFREQHKTGHIPRFEAVFNMLKTGASDSFAGLVPVALPSALDLYNYDTQHDIYLVIAEDGDDTLVKIALKCDEEGKRMLPHLLDTYMQLLDCCTDAPQMKVSELPMMTDSERLLLNRVNDTNVSAPFSSVINLFRKAAQAWPAKQAVITSSESITYRELDACSDAVAAHLHGIGIGTGQLVGIFADRTPQMITALLGVLKAGAAYVPLDTAFPPARLQYMIEDAQLKTIIVSRGNEKKLTTDIPLLQLEACIDEPFLPVKISGESTAYVIYTSGSTGNPKGVEISHYALGNFIEGMYGYLPWEEQTVLCLTTISFDIFVLESFVPLTAGATIVLANETAQQDPELLLELVSAARVTVMQATPSRMKLLLKQKPEIIAPLSYLLVGGETMSSKLASDILRGFEGVLMNMYGPTETTVWSSASRLSATDTVITVGRPIRNTRIYIVNGAGKPCGPGVRGEVLITGDGLAKGYLNRPDLTAASFVAMEDIPGWLYRTGDSGWWTANGKLVIAGRTDNQLKIRGYRIEPEEIEHCLRTLSGVDDVVVVRAVASPDELTAFYTGTMTTDSQELRKQLKSVLPAYMIPARFERIGSFAYTPNQKIDRKYLEQLPLSVHQQVSMPAQKIVVSGLVALWSQVLEQDIREDENLQDHDFFELGGHSLKALELLAAVENETGVKITIREFLKRPTLGFLQERLSIN